MLGLNKQKGNMYDFVTHTWNAIKGECSHICSYCYMKRLSNIGSLRIVDKELTTNFGSNKTIFVGSSTDMFASNVPSDWIIRVLKHCNQYNDNTYLFQTKNPKRFKEFEEFYPKDSIFATTLETNREDYLYNCPSRSERIEAMKESWIKRKMISIEPIMDFDLDIFKSIILDLNPEFIVIGADSTRSKDYYFTEPSSYKVKTLINDINLSLKIVKKNNLHRLLWEEKNVKK
jgi:protein gp37